MSWPIALMKFLSECFSSLGVAEHTYVVGGAVRNHLLGQPVKDLDIVIDSVASGRDSEWLAKELLKSLPSKSNLTTNQYGVAIVSIKGFFGFDGVDLSGKTIEIATARKESYGGAAGKGYKPHMVAPATIHEDLLRREFTFNTLLWRFSDLRNGPESAPVIDLLGSGRANLEERVLRTPSDPDKTFSDDPTRMLRAVKFIARYAFELPSEVEESIIRNASKLKDMPWNAIQEILVRDILFGPCPRESLDLMYGLGLTKVIGELLVEEPGFASGLGRFLNDVRDLHLVLDILDLGWKVRTPVGFLSPDDQLRLRGILKSRRWGDAYEEFFLHLVRPPIDQPALFREFGLEGQNRARVLQVARQSLLEQPDLAGDHPALEAAVRLELGRS